MKHFLIALSIGPVQSLIGAARRTRDLWCGSWLLSEVARAAADALHQNQPGCLIFPCIDDRGAAVESDRRPGDAANISNVLRAEVSVPDNTAARNLCRSAKSAAISRLTQLSKHARSQLTELRDDVWNAQVDDILEGFAAWVLVAEGPNGYREANNNLSSVLLARKATRDFRPCPPLLFQGLPKSSLDGALETVLLDWPTGHRDRIQLGLSEGEQLDALGVIKRLAGDPEQFTAYSRVAADPWIEQLAPVQQTRLREAYEDLVALGIATRTKGNAKAYESLPYDAQMLFPFRLENALSVAKQGESHALNEFRECFRQISNGKTEAGQPIGIPVPYAVILKADGDRMGALLSRAGSAEESRNISRNLHRFASNVPRIVRKHRGHAIYAGGDDVLALVPLMRALECAKALASSFEESLAGIVSEMGVSSADRPTLSVGLGIGHLMEPLGSLRARAERAELAAKGSTLNNPRNALAIKLGIRSGAELCWRAQWTDEDAFDALFQLTAAYRDGLLPARAAYDLRAIHRQFAWLRDDSSASANGMRAAEVVRMLEKARTRGGYGQIPVRLQSLILECARKQPLAELADTLVIARWLSARTADEVGEHV